MTIARLILRNLFYFRGVNLAVIAGVAVATAALSGALMVGDSVRASLVDLAVKRLGKIDHALISNRFFDARLIDRLNSDPAIKERFEIVPAVIVRGGASLDNVAARTAGVQIIGVGGDWVPVTRGQSIINSQTANALDLQAAGGDFVLSVPTESDVPRESTLAHRTRQDVLSGLRARVSSIVSEPGFILLFSPTGSQRSPQSAWVNLTDLQDAVGRRGQANTLLVHDKLGTSDGAAMLNLALRRSISLSDYGLEIVAAGNESALTSRSTYIAPPIEAAAEVLAQAENIRAREITVNLINSVSNGASSIHYAVAAGITPLGEAELADDEVALNEWAAQRLGAKPGDRLAFKYYRRQSDGSLAEVAAEARVARILPMSGLGADPSLTPIYKGLTDADTISSWNPPAEVNINKSLVTEADEAYWKQYKAAPKLFFNFATAKRLWGQAFGNATSLRVPADRSGEFFQRLRDRLDPATMGLSFRPLRQEQVAAAGGTTDFGQLFIGFSFFLIIAAALLVAMLLRLSVEQRARQLGAMSALGFGGSSLRKIMLSEGMLLSILGGIVGSLAAIGYTWLMMAGLRTWWIGAIGTTAMRLEVVPMTLVIGFISSQVVAFLAILWAVKQVGRAAPARLLAGGWETAASLKSRSGLIYSSLGIAGMIVAFAIIIAGTLKMISEQVAFLAGGAILLTSGLLLLAGLLQPKRSQSSIESVARLGIRNSRRHPARSVLCIGLIAFAAFALVTVAAMRQGEPSDTADPRSGAGGFRLIAESDIPLPRDPSTEQGRNVLGFREPSNPIWNKVQFLSMRRRDGQDISCLNLTQITNPTILGVPRTLIDQGGFTRDGSNPWKLLEQADSSGAIPVITDHSTATYILHIGIGQTIDVLDDSGQPRKLRLAAMLNGSIFQSQLLMSDEHFRSMFPNESGFGMLLAKVGAEDQEQVRRLLSDELNEFAASAQTTASLLANYMEVQNTYLSTFQLLGALGLMLGTIGLAVVLIRTVIERKSELALMAAIGFRTDTRVQLILMENAFLLVMGLVLGSACALIGVLPALRESARQINFTSLILTLLGALLIGLCASGLAVVASGRHISSAELRRE